MRHNWIVWTSLLWLSCILVLAANNDPGSDSTSALSKFCRRFEHRSAVVNNKLYVDGGYINGNLSTDAVNHTNNFLLYSDLATTQNGQPAVALTQSKNGSVPSVAGGVFWADQINNVLYAFGGYFMSGDPVPFVTWTFDDLTQIWTKITTTLDQPSYVAHGASTVAQDAGIGYYLGGYQDETTRLNWQGIRRYVSGLMSFDMVYHKYTNLVGPDDRGRGEGLLTFIPASERGVLVYFGGLIQEKAGSISSANMSSIWLWDVTLGKWYNQIATGDVPDSRIRFCGGMASPDDKSSYNIYIYGGMKFNETTTEQAEAFDDFYVLSIPAFRWLKLFPGNISIPFPHHSMTCNMINNTQLMVVGGSVPTSQMCDVSDVYGQHSVDLSEPVSQSFIWSTFRTDNPKYRVPNALVSIIGGNNKGSSNVTKPLSGNVSYDPLLFERKYNVPIRYPTPASTPLAPLAKGPNQSLVIGLVVGSVVAGMVFGGIAVFCVTWNRRKHKVRIYKPPQWRPISSINLIDEHDSHEMDNVEGKQEISISPPPQGHLELKEEHVRALDRGHHRHESHESNHGGHKRHESKEVKRASRMARIDDKLRRLQ